MDDWEADQTADYEYRTAYLWIVPARVQGTWRFDLQGGASFTIDLEQSFQQLSGTVDLGPIRAGLRDPRLKGAVFSFDFVDDEGVLHELDGRAADKDLEGSYQAGTRSGRFRATRTEPRPLPGLAFRLFMRKTTPAS